MQKHHGSYVKASRAIFFISYPSLPCRLGTWNFDHQSGLQSLSHSGDTVAVEKGLNCTLREPSCKQRGRHFLPSAPTPSGFPCNSFALCFFTIDDVLCSLLRRLCHHSEASSRHAYLNGKDGSPRGQLSSFRGWQAC